MRLQARSTRTVQTDRLLNSHQLGSVLLAYVNDDALWII